jgi:hypothetical protein
MKKLTMLLLVFLVSSAAVFADDHGFSVGGGFSFVFNYITATMDYGPMTIPVPGGGSTSVPASSTKQTVKEFNYGGCIFFDAKYVEFVVTVAGGPSDIDVENPPAMGGGEGSYSKNSVNLGFSVLGKYPFQLGPVTLFPLAGIDYIVYLTGTYPADDKTTQTPVEGVNRNVAGDFNTLWFKFGGGVDVPIKEKLFVRVEALYGFGLENKFQKNGEKEAEAYSGKVNWGWVNGPTVRVGLGYRF